MTLSVEETPKEEVVTTPSEEPKGPQEEKKEADEVVEPKASDEEGIDVKEECPLAKAEELYNNEKLLVAAEVLNAITDPNIVLEEKHLSIIENAKEGQALIDDLKAEPGVGSGEDGEWVDHGVSGGRFPTRLLHRLEQTDKGVQLRARCETPIRKDLLSPLLSVLNETQLYKSWMPSWTTPKFGLRKCEKLKQIGRVSQILHIKMELPWPMAPREFTLARIAFDDIEENGNIAIKMKTVKHSDNYDEVVPELEKKSVPVDIDGGFLFTSCPKDHPTMEKVDDSDEQLVLVRFSAMLDPNMKLLPQSFLNFLVKVAFGTCWKIMLGIALDVKNGKRPDHAEAISTKDELYAWIEGRLDVMLSLMKSATGLKEASVA